MGRRTPVSTRTYTLVPYTALFRSRSRGDRTRARGRYAARWRGRVQARCRPGHTDARHPLDRADGAPQRVVGCGFRPGLRVFHDRPDAAARGGGTRRRAAAHGRVAGTGTHGGTPARHIRSEVHTSELKSLMRIAYAVLCLK